MRGMDLFKKLTRQCKTLDEVSEVVVTGQVLTSMPEDIRIWVREKKPATAAEAGQLTGDYIQARGPISHSRRTEQTKRPDNRDRPTNLRSEPAVQARKGSTYQPRPQGNSTTGRTSFQNTRNQPMRRGEVTCYTCGNRGHMSMQCPSRPTINVDALPKKTEVYRTGIVGGVPVTDIVLDTGCSQTLVHRDLVPDEHLSGEEVAIHCAPGDVLKYPVANVQLMIGSTKIDVKAGVSETLPAAVLLGTDVDEMLPLLQETHHSKGAGRPQVAKALAVETRAQAKHRQKEEVLEKLKESRSAATPTPIEAQPEKEQSQTSDPDFNFHDALFEGGQPRTRLTRRQKRADRHAHFSPPPVETNPIVPHPLELSKKDLEENQMEDPSLAAIRQVAGSVPNSAVGTGYYEKDGLLYRQWTPPGMAGDEPSIEKLVLPLKYRATVLRMAHRIPLAGHLGKTKTTRRILQRFYWPTVFRDVANYCRSCEECQKIPGRSAPKALMVSLPVVLEPFSRIAMDIIGPLPRSRSGNHFILVICDYATRYPEAIPLRNIDAEHIAEELVKVLARVGIPDEVLSDQGTNFMSQLMAEL